MKSRKCILFILKNRKMYYGHTRFLIVVKRTGQAVSHVSVECDITEIHSLLPGRFAQIAGIQL